MTEHALQWEEAARDRVLAHLEKFCGGCLQCGDCYLAGEPSALDACFYVKRLVQEETEKPNSLSKWIAAEEKRRKHIVHGCVITEEPI